MSPEEKPDNSAAGENHAGGFFEYMGLPSNPELFLNAVDALPAEEYLAGVFAYLGKDMDEELRRSDVHCPRISSSPEELLASISNISTRDPKRCGGSTREHLYMLCDCYYRPRAAAAAPTPPVSAVVVDADYRPAPPDHDGGLLAYTQDDAEQDEVAAAAATVDVVTASVEDEVIMNARGFDDFARDLKETIETINPEDALRARGSSSVSPRVRPPV
ncbi:hypothetical protein E2562_005531 [Oryza meyeriana var. granulata]|uniref:Uncharacterized protein n=1 Tax=Oryza meyeriana var. granulata TaxID=110450 RepID=A0A6G1F3W9_9ORYZ|nr:hypothetical protein E2562_005531 [Oryza meyeriana var. granulata]